MATIKIRFRIPSVTAKEGTLAYRVIHKKEVRQLSSGYRVFQKEWDSVRSEVCIPPEASTSRKIYLEELKASIFRDMAIMDEIVCGLECTGREYTAGDVLRKFCAYPAGGFISFADSLIAGLRNIGRERTAEKYTTVLNSFMRFMAGRGDISLDKVDSVLMMEYEMYLKSCGICPNSTSFYMRGLRAVYKRAVDSGLTVQREPFRHVFTGICKTAKRAVPISVIRRIRDLDLASAPTLDYARDLFMFSFYTRGMSFVDIAFLKKTDLKNGVLTYRRHKTGQQLFVKWEKPMQEILEKYNTDKTPYLLPVIRHAGQDEIKQYRNASHLVNAKLKKLGTLLGLSIPLTMYVARHGWASIAHSKNIPVSTISEALGHDSENTTRIYLASLDASVVDEANSIILKSL